MRAFISFPPSSDWTAGFYESTSTRLVWSIPARGRYRTTRDYWRCHANLTSSDGEAQTDRRSASGRAQGLHALARREGRDARRQGADVEPHGRREERAREEGRSRALEEEENGSMKCPHCLESFFDAAYTQELRCVHNGVNLPLVEKKPGETIQTKWSIESQLCPACGRAIISLLKGHVLPLGPVEEILVWPRGIARAPLPPEVIEPFRSDYREACNVLADSPKASAALSR